MKISQNWPAHQKLYYENLCNFRINPWPFQPPKICLSLQMVNNLLLGDILKLTLIIFTQAIRNNRVTQDFKQLIIVKVGFLKFIFNFIFFMFILIYIKCIKRKWIVVFFELQPLFFFNIILFFFAVRGNCKTFL